MIGEVQSGQIVVALGVNEYSTTKVFLFQQGILQAVAPNQ